jgi:phage shock protein A
MSYFSRLTDIITCNLTSMLDREGDAAAALPRIIHEMEEGLQGALRSVKSATLSAERIEKEIGEHSAQIDQLAGEARRELSNGREQDARGLLLWKREVEDVVAGLRQQHQAAVNTRDHLNTILRAVESRLCEARRRQAELETGVRVKAGAGPMRNTGTAALADARAREVDAELEALKREMGQHA